MPPLTTLDDALSLDVSVLTALLRRNRCAHGRTLYHQRTSMVVRALVKYNVLNLRQQIHSIQTSLDEIMLQQQQQRSSRKRRRRQEEEEHWVLDIIVGHHYTQNKKSSEKKKTTANDDDSHLPPAEQLLQLQQSQVQTTLLIHLPEILSRIHYATCALVVEISRGFFLPFCTVALASLARIRVLVMRLGREGLTELMQIQQQQCSSQQLLFSRDQYDDAMKVFVETDVNSQMQRQLLREQTIQSLGIDVSEYNYLNTSATSVQGSPSVTTTTTDGDDQNLLGVARVENETCDVEQQPSKLPHNNDKDEIMQQKKDDHDIGESVDLTHDLLQVVRSSAPHQQETIKSDQHGDDGERDVNLDLVRELQAKKKDREGKKKRKSNEHQKAELSQRDSGDKKKKKKRKKESSKRKDVFFDEIFGDS